MWKVLFVQIEKRGCHMGFLVSDWLKFKKSSPLKPADTMNCYGMENSVENFHISCR